MAGMGKTGTVNITPEMMDEAIKAIQAYRTTAFGAADGNGSDGLYGTVKKPLQRVISLVQHRKASLTFTQTILNLQQVQVSKVRLRCLNQFARVSNLLYQILKALMSNSERKITSNL